MEINFELPLNGEARRIVADALKDAAIRINDDGLQLPETEWRQLRDVCDSLEAAAGMVTIAGFRRGHKLASDTPRVRAI